MVRYTIYSLDRYSFSKGKLNGQQVWYLIWMVSQMANVTLTLQTYLLYMYTHNEVVRQNDFKTVIRKKMIIGPYFLQGRRI